MTVFPHSFIEELPKKASEFWLLSEDFSDDVNSESQGRILVHSGIAAATVFRYLTFSGRVWHLLFFGSSFPS